MRPDLGHGAYRTRGQLRRRWMIAPSARSSSICSSGLGRGALLPYASYYMTGFLHETPLWRVSVKISTDLESNALAPRGEPEDHIAILLEVMAGLARAAISKLTSANRRDFFERHLKPWAARMFADLEMSRSANFYRAVGRVGRCLY